MTTRGKSPFSLRFNAAAITDANQRRAKAARYRVVKDGRVMGYADKLAAAERLALSCGGRVVDRSEST